MKIGNMKIGTRLACGFAAVLLLLVAIAGLGLSRLALLESRLEQITQENSVEGMAAISMRATISDRMIALRNIVLLNEVAEMEPEVERVRNNEKKYDKFRDKILAMFASLPSTSAEERAEMDAVAALSAQAAPIIEKAIKLGLANQNDEATRVLLKELRPVQFKWVAALNVLVDHETKLNEASVVEARLAYTHACTLMLVLAGCAILGGVVIAWFITRGITRPISAAVKIAQTVATGDLTSEIAVTTTDETGQLLQALKDMNGNLEGIVTQVRSGTDTIATASSEIAAGNLDLSSRTEQQASSLEETASSMEEITSTVRQNADNARQANQLAAAASGVAVRGGEVVSKVITTMDAINASSRKIEEIISVIDGIAFQTNILALNAAVEAARAGEQGRGFAVVASEVRNLAHRSAAAAKEIKVLISDSVQQVSAGAKLVGEAGETMEQIVVSVRQVTDIMGDISTASLEQSTGIEQVNQAVSQMDTVTQQNAALVEQAAAAAGSLEEQAGNLSRVVSIFTLKGDLAAASGGVGRPAAARRGALKLSAA